MMFTSFASSSAGNVYLVEDGRTALLLECGVSFKKIQKYLGYTFETLAGCLVTHEHKDHAQAVPQLLKSGIPVYCSQGTALALAEEGTREICAGEQFTVGTFDVLPFDTFHDAAEPLGFLIGSRVDGETLAFATDTVALGYRFPGVTRVAIEANYQEDILAQCRKMPEKVQHRIRNSHMEIDRLARYLGGLELDSCREIYLLHLSDSCSREAAFIQKIRRAVGSGILVNACEKGGK